MKPYGFRSIGTKGISGRRKSKATPHRERCLRVDKKNGRQRAKGEIEVEIVKEE